MKFYLFTIFLLSSTLMANYAQEVATDSLDTKYKEDQFYIGVTYNLLSNKPDGLSQNGFSGGLHIGFIKDMPINERRNMAIGLGIGYSGNSFNNNMLIDKTTTEATTFSILNNNDTSYSKNKFSMHLIEVPLEFRWRTSTAAEYNFWRIYTGFKVGYLFAHSAKHQGDLGSFNYNDIKDFNDFQYALTLSAGYNTWNVYFYYALNPIFSKATINGKNLDLSAIKIGLQFYIL